MYTFLFKGGEYTLSSPRQTPIRQRSFIFGIVGGKEIPLYQLIKSGIVKQESVATPINTFGIPKTDTNSAWEQQPLNTYKTKIKHWKLFSQAKLMGIKNRTHSIYIKLSNDTLKPVASIIPVGDTDSYFNQVMVFYPTATKPRSNFRFAARMQLVNRDQLSNILNSDALKWAKLVPMPPIPMLKEMVSVSKNSKVRTHRIVRIKRG